LVINVESEINIHLLEGSPPAFIAELLYEKISSSNAKIDEKNLNVFFFFLIKVGRFDLLLFYFQKNIGIEDFHWHRAYFLYAVIKAFPNIDDDLKEILYNSLNEKNNDQFWVEAAQTKVGDKIFPELKNHRKKIQEHSKKRYAKKRADQIQKFILFQSQQLVEPAKKIIKRLEKTFPFDEEIKSLSQSYNEVDAQAVFDKYKFKEKSILKKPKNDPDVDLVKQNLEQILLKDLEQHKDFYEDLVILCLFIESHETALAIIKNYQNELKSVWLFVEVLVKNNRYLEILNILPIIEKSLSNDPEAFFASTYYRAICFWNLGERNTALEVLESLIDANPNYRASEVLIEEWRKL